MTTKNLRDRSRQVKTLQLNQVKALQSNQFKALHAVQVKAREAFQPNHEIDLRVKQV